MAIQPTSGCTGAGHRVPHASCAQRTVGAPESLAAGAVRFVRRWPSRARRWDEQRPSVSCRRRANSAAARPNHADHHAERNHERDHQSVSNEGRAPSPYSRDSGAGRTGHAADRGFVNSITAASTAIGTRYRQMMSWRAACAASDMGISCWWPAGRAGVAAIACAPDRSTATLFRRRARSVALGLSPMAAGRTWPTAPAAGF